MLFRVSKGAPHVINKLLEQEDEVKMMVDTKVGGRGSSCCGAAPAATAIYCAYASSAADDAMHHAVLRSQSWLRHQGR